MKPTQAPGPHEPAVRDSQDRLVELQRLAVEDPTGRWYLPLASLLLEQQAISEAQTLVRHSLARDPDAIGGWVLLGRSYWMSGEPAAARRIMASVLARDPENAHALRVHAQAEAELGEPEAAIRGYRALLRIVPGDVAAQEALAELLDRENGTAIEVPGPRSVPTAVGEEVAALAPNGGRSRSNGTPAAAPPAHRRGGRSSRRPDERKRAVRASEAPAGQSSRTAKRQTLPPAHRPGSGIFESLPADLDWGRKVAERRRATTAQPTAERKRGELKAAEPKRAERKGPGRKPGGAHHGYRRWLDRILAKEGAADEKGAPDRGPDADV